ncbi:MAG: nucleoside monophosphate kinase [Gammaproteobacteria bacterium]|nr:nucleoside monophosphate kinase [Gammaproteobacteria bacterium]MYG65585.1 nucleoside monophosphate kinase [Gammaproteobacteria bacterium]
MRIALIGVSGSGKSAQAKLLAGKYRISHISTGDLLREEARIPDRLSEEDRLALEEGQLVSDDVVRELLEERLRRKDTKRGFVIDGYPRNIPQAQSLDNLLGMLGRPLQIAIFTEMDDRLLVKRNVGRQVCTVCGEIYNRNFSPPAVADVCDKCAAPLGVRRKDTPKAVESRVAEYKKKTVPLITYFRAQHKLRTVVANGSLEEIHDKVCAIVDLEIRPLEIGAVFSAADSSAEEDKTVIAGGQINRIVSQKQPKATPGRRKPAVKSTTKTAAKKVAPKVSGSGGTGAKKAAPAKVAATRTAAAKKVTKKAAQKKTPVRKVVVKKVAAKKAAAKKVATKKVAAKKAAARKVTVKKVTAKKAAAKKSTARKVTARKATVKKTPARKVVTGKASAKLAPRKAPAKKKTAGKAAPGKPAGAGAGKKASKKVSKKTGTGKAPAGKATGRKR